MSIGQFPIPIRCRLDVDRSNESFLAYDLNLNSDYPDYPRIHVRSVWVFRIGIDVKNIRIVRYLNTSRALVRIDAENWSNASCVVSHELLSRVYFPESFRSPISLSLSPPLSLSLSSAAIIIPQKRKEQKEKEINEIKGHTREKKKQKEMEKERKKERTDGFEDSDAGVSHRARPISSSPRNNFYVPVTTD